METLYKNSKYIGLLDKRVKVICTDGSTVIGVWVYWTSELDNEPDGESITIQTDYGILIEIYVSDIKDIVGL